MNFLSIDCSTDLNSLFIKHQSKTYSKILQSDKSNYDLLMRHILDFFSKNNLKLEDINEIFVNQGPGSFSGLRSSISVAKGISLSKNLNLYGYNTFILSCSSFFDKKDFNLIGWQTEDIYQNLVITYIYEIKINQNIEENIFKLPKRN